MVRIRALLVCLTAGTGLWLTIAARPAISSSDPTSAVTAAAAWAAELLCGYLLLATLTVALTRIVIGTRRMRRTWAPRLVVRTVDAAIGVSTAVAVVAGGAPAWATPPAPARPPAIAVPVADWPGLTDGAPAPAPAPASGEPLVVRRGDSLWTLTRRWLGASASTATVARRWPQLYAANRAVIGADPDVIHPGQRLVPPPADERTTR